MKFRETIDELLNAKEGGAYQFKEWKNKDDLKEATNICCALANCGGGKLVLGVTDKRPRKVVGSTAFPQPARTIVDIMNKLHVRVDFEIYKHENGRVLVFDVASRPIGLPVQSDGGAWWYKGDSLGLMPEDVRRTIYTESSHDFSGDICLDATVDDLDNGAIETFRNLWVENSGNKRIASLTTEQLLKDCGAITDDGVTYAAIILFGKHKILRKCLPQSEVIFEYRSSEAAGPAAQREEFCEGFFINSHTRIWELVNLRNDKQFYQNKLAVLPVPTFNERVVREALLNAVSHRDYQLGGSVFVRQYQNRIVFENPGGLPNGITVENILHRQSPRNNLIAAMFQLCGLVERSGQGMNLIYEQSVKESKPLPSFDGSDAYFTKLTLTGKVVSTQMLAFIKKMNEDQLNAMTTDDYILLSTLFSKKGFSDIHPSKFEHLIELGIVKQTEHGIELANGDLVFAIDSIVVSPSEFQSTVASGWQALETSDRKKQIITFIADNESATSLQLAQFTGLSQGRVRAVLKELVIDGVIEKFGDNRYTSYKLKK